jgi:hypothetical protein
VEFSFYPYTTEIFEISNEEQKFQYIKEHKYGTNVKQFFLLANFFSKKLYQLKNYLHLCPIFLIKLWKK